MSAKQPTWNQRFGAKRRAIDRALLAELERTLPALKDHASLNTFTVHMDRWVDEDTHRAIARHFGNRRNERTAPCGSGRFLESLGEQTGAIT
jgi:hypothetical protein